VHVNNYFVAVKFFKIQNSPGLHYSVEIAVIEIAIIQIRIPTTARRPKNNYVNRFNYLALPSVAASPPEGTRRSTSGLFV
jgi:hypothetical protein